ncbi:P-loop containing nucleoside triphosphate hydrolase protein [Viridothelium virens]|uniref:P-loop containing nucleoside triphosphate hydrolase protein n=1 Tax=Viridothelium virens TaxID=1048519 RepID=A0A6A6HHU5_VIRVR|nr:P-loop containing nucleoside triphosphate hydrolase protein [Viridothelium virens]
MVDIWNFRRAFPNSETARSNATSDLSEDDMRQEKPPGDEFVFLLPLSVYAFNFQDKNWRTLLVSNTGEVEWNEAAFDTVVLAEDTKTLVKALVMNMIEPGNATDIISGKGNGLVMLLHGGPGTGKTLTAESVAEYARKPLYRVTCGDIGTSPTAVEKHLKNVLMLGKSWDAVVLLDEAEVFLQERSLVDINRNALVSVFLRVLEYYDGILILTSNRVGIFDEGFKSRIQLAIHYDKLGLASRIQVWSNFIDRLATSQHGELDIDDLERHVNDLARYVLNGREIRNALTTGRQLARYEKKPLTYESLKHVIDVSSRFDKYLKDVNDGLDDDQLARDECLR